MNKQTSGLARGPKEVARDRRAGNASIEGIMAVPVTANMDPRLKELAGRKADEAGLTLSEFVVRALATYLQRPELSHVPRKKMGRPRKAISIPA